MYITRCEAVESWIFALDKSYHASSCNITLLQRNTSSSG